MQVVVILLLLLCGTAWGQFVPIPSEQLLLEIAPPPSPTLTANYVGSQGSQRYYYWIVANYPAGVSPTGNPTIISNAAPLSGSNRVLLGWTRPNHAQSFDLIRTIIPSLVSCQDCLLANDLNGTNFTDTGATIGNYSPQNPITRSRAVLTVDNRRFNPPRVTFDRAIDGAVIDTSGFELLVNKDVNGGYIGRAGDGSASIPGEFTAVGGVRVGVGDFRLERWSYCFTLFDDAADLTDTIDIPSVFMFGDDFGVLVDKIQCEVNANTASINFQRDDGTPANLLSASLVCDTNQQTSCASGCDVDTIQAAEDNFAIGDDLDFVMAAIDAGVRRLSVCLYGVKQ